MSKQYSYESKEYETPIWNTHTHTKKILIRVRHTSMKPYECDLLV